MRPHRAHVDDLEQCERPLLDLHNTDLVQAISIGGRGESTQDALVPLG